MSDAITVTIDRAEVDRLQSVLQRIVATTRRKMPNLIKQAFIFAVQSATRATHPGEANRPSKMAKRFRIRPVVKGVLQFGGFYFYRYWDRTGQQQAFRSDKLISRTLTKSGKPRKGRGVELITTGVKYWSKRIHGWDTMPITGVAGSTSTERKQRIPHYGAAKVGFILMLRALGKPGETDGERTDLATVQQNFGDLAFIRGVNQVGYAGKTSPAAANIGISKAANRIEATYLRQLAKEVMPPEATP